MQSSSRTPRGKHWLDQAFALIICASLLLSSIAAAPAPRLSQTDTPPATPTEAPAAAPEATEAPAVTAAAPIDPARVNFRQIVVKFKDGTDVTVENQRMVGASADLSSVVQALNGLDVRPLFSTGLQVQDQLKASAAGNAAGLPALDRYYYVQLSESATVEEAQAVLQSLQANSSVETAYMEPLYTAASSKNIAADLSGRQTYLDADPGMNVRAAWTISGARGLAVQLVDVEDGWQIGHEDLPIRSGDLIESSNSSDTEWVNHGTGVIGVIAAKNNGFGVTGIASDTAVRLVSRVTNLTADAIVKAAANSVAGDIILIPVQAIGPVSDTTCPTGCDCSRFESIPIEYWQANHDAIQAATVLGIIVVEAAGNGAMDLDDTRYGGNFNRSNRDSGALLVGAGVSDATHAPVCDANYGKRIDVQGWGENVTTTGYGDAPESGPSANEFYTDQFSGTSAASAMVAGVVSSLQGVARARGYLLTPSEMRSILRSTGTAQTAETDKPIGPLPNLKKAIDTKISAGVTLLEPADNATNVYTLKPTFKWQAYLNATQYELQVSDKSTFSTLTIDITTSGTEYTPTSNLSSGRQYFWRVRAFVGDVWQDWSSNVFRFTPSGSSAPSVTLLKPDNNYVTSNAENFRPTFTWKQSSPVPDGYQIQISTSYDFTGAADVFVTDPTYTPGAALAANARYYWRVRSYNGTPPVNASFGPWTARRIFFAGPDISGIGPLQILADGQEDTLRPTFDWTDITDARAYQVQVSTANTFKTVSLNAVVPLPSDGTLIPSQLTPGSDLPKGKTLYWRVRAKGTYAWSSWSATETLTTLNPPAAPKQLKPDNGAAVNTWETGVLFTWSKPSNNPTSYHIQIAADKKFESIVLEDDSIPNPDPADPIKTPNYTAVGLSAENVYYWRVRAIGDGTGNWSSVRTVKTTPPAPTGMAVDDLSSLRPTFNWDKTDSARYYNIQVAKDNAAETDKSKLYTSSRIVANVTTFSSPPYVLGDTLPRNTDLVWRIRACGLYGCSVWAYADDSFTTPYPPNTPQLLSPANGSNVANFTPTLDWADSVKIKNHTESDPTSYEVQISSRTDFSAPDPTVDFFESFDGLTTSRFVVPIDLLAKSGTYYWRVRAQNADGQYSVWSSRYSFITPGIITGTITDALSGDPLPSVTVQLSSLQLQTTTNSSGEYTLRGVPSGDYSLAVAVSGYIRQSVTVSSGPGANRVRDIALAQIPDTGTIRIVVTWNGSPADMDAHLWLPASDKYHVYKDQVGNLGGFPNAEMERSDSDGYGPEIISIDQMTGNGTYRFAVYSFGSASTFDATKARVQVYDGATKIADVSVPTNGSGHWWNVFTLDSVTRKIKVNSFLTDTNPAPYTD